MQNSNQNFNIEPSSTENIEKLLFEAFRHQNSEYYDDALENLQTASDQLIRIIESMQKGPQFYMKVMPIMKQERQLVPEQQYKEFWGKNEKVLCRNFEKNAYRALIMQQLKEQEMREMEKMTDEGNGQGGNGKKAKGANKKKRVKTTESFEEELMGDEFHHIASERENKIEEKNQQKQKRKNSVKKE